MAFRQPELFDVNIGAVSHKEPCAAVTSNEYVSRRSMEAPPTAHAEGLERGPIYVKPVHQTPLDFLEETSQYQLQCAAGRKKEDLLDAVLSDTGAAGRASRKKTPNSKKSVPRGNHGYQDKEGMATRAPAKERSKKVLLPCSTGLVERSSCEKRKRPSSKLMCSSFELGKHKPLKPAPWEAATLDFLSKVHHTANEFEIYEYTIKQFNSRGKHRCLSDLRHDVAMIDSGCLDPPRDKLSDNAELYEKEEGDAPSSLNAGVLNSQVPNGPEALCPSVSIIKEENADECLSYRADLPRGVCVVSDDDDEFLPFDTYSSYVSQDGYEEETGEPDMSDDALMIFFERTNEALIGLQTHICGGEAIPMVSRCEKERVQGLGHHASTPPDLNANITLTAPGGTSTAAIDSVQIEPSVDTVHGHAGDAKGMDSKKEPSSIQAAPQTPGKEMASEAVAICKKEELASDPASSDAYERPRPKWRRLTLTRRPVEGFDGTAKIENANQAHSQPDSSMLIKESVESPALYMGIEAEFPHLTEELDDNRARGMLHSVTQW